MRPRLDPLLEDTLAAVAATAGLGTVVSALYWLTTGLSPWPMVVLGAVAGFGFGLALLALTSPRQRS
ncbi:MAG: hypothetical protein HY690_21090 [Chloroflexi bacterium]|nr:hypothetical protein [Chloroflexota bacterium]